MKSFAALLSLTASLALACPRLSLAHGFEGDRFFPPTITADDPFSKDEFALSIQSFLQPMDPGGTRTREVDFGAGFNKEIFPGFAIGISGAFTTVNPDQGGSLNGFQDFVLSTKYQLLESPAHEFILSVGGYWKIGGTGARVLGEDSFSTFTPSIFIGKGLGDLPASLNALRPIAITSVIGEELPTKAAASNALDYDFAVEYNLLYLQEHVRDIGLPHPFRDMIPLVEIALTSPENRGGGTTTGSINPGVLYESRFFQVGAEALIPINHQSGSGVGFLVNVNLYIDDLLPKLFGHPLFGGHSQAGNTAAAPSASFK